MTMKKPRTGIDASLTPNLVFYQSPSSSNSTLFHVTLGQSTKQSGYATIWKSNMILVFDQVSKLRHMPAGVITWLTSVVGDISLLVRLVAL